MIGKTQKVIFENRQESDHKLVRVKIAKDIDIGRGTWIFNNTLLGNEVFTTEIRKIIRIYKNENKKISFPNNRVSWEFFNMEAKKFSQQLSKKLARERRREIEIVRNKLEILESIPKEKISNDIKNEVDRLKKIEWEYNEKQLKGHIIRSRVPHMEEGEGNISFYTKLEKRKGEENLIFF
jgi:hypothetical protein